MEAICCSPFCSSGKCSRISFLSSYFSSLKNRLIASGVNIFERWVIAPSSFFWAAIRLLVSLLMKSWLNTFAGFFYYFFSGYSTYIFSGSAYIASSGEKAILLLTFETNYSESIFSSIFQFVLAARKRIDLRLIKISGQKYFSAQLLFKRQHQKEIR